MDKSATKTLTARTRARNCVHHWTIESPNGKESTGVCKRCGSTKNFANSTESVMWERTNTLRADISRQPSHRARQDEIKLSDDS